MTADQPLHEHLRRHAREKPDAPAIDTPPWRRRRCWRSLMWKRAR